MENRIENRFIEQKKKAKKSLIPFVMPGMPNLSSTFDLILSLEDLGSDCIEIGVPFSDPVADGPVIQRAAGIALENGVYTDQVFELACKVRERSDLPMVFLTYYNSIFRYGRKKFIKHCSEAGVDGLIIPDLPFEENKEIKDVMEGTNIDLITLVTPTSAGRLKKVLKDAEGFVYCVSTTGVTGERSKLSEELKGMLTDIGKYTDIPRAVGFGISGPEQVIGIRDYCEGIIVGSALLRRLMEDGIKSGLEFMRIIRQALDGK